MRGAITGQSVRRVGVIGDVHTEIDTLERVVTHLRGLDLDALLCTGDIPDGPCHGDAVDRCCALLKAAGVVTICGNHDRWLEEGRARDEPNATLREEVGPSAWAFLQALPAMVELDTPTGRALLCHGLGPDDMAAVHPHDRGRGLEENERLQELLRDGRYAYVINGHTHRRMVRAVGSLTIVNAGTLLSEHGAGFVTIDFESQSVRLYDVPPDGAIVEARRIDV